MPFRIVVLGGYGHFGGRIARALAQEAPIALFIAGRHGAAAAAFTAKLRGSAHCEPIVLDHGASDFAAALRGLRPDLVVHTSGPFQGQSYHVAHAAIAAGAHYLDLADGRAFVTGIAALDAAARARGVVVVAGASTLPALSGAVIAHLQPGFARMETVAISIAPAQRIPRGPATMASILSYCGRSFPQWSKGQWRRVHGWQGLHRLRYPGLEPRWAARCDVPDLGLLPALYPTLRSVRFDAALELAGAQFGLWLLSWWVRAGGLRRPESLAPLLLRLATALDCFGSDLGAMHVAIAGIGRDGKTLQRDWQLRAASGHGPEIACIPALVIARKLARGEYLAPGARPCQGMMTLAEFDAATRHLQIGWQVREPGTRQ